MAYARYFGRHRFGSVGLVWCMAGVRSERVRPARRWFWSKRPAAAGARVVVLPNAGAHRGATMSRAA